MGANWEDRWRVNSIRNEGWEHDTVLRRPVIMACAMQIDLKGVQTVQIDMVGNIISFYWMALSIINDPQQSAMAIRIHLVTDSSQSARCVR